MLSAARIWGLGSKGDIRDEPERSVVDRLLSLQERNMEGILRWPVSVELDAEAIV